MKPKHLLLFRQHVKAKAVIPRHLMRARRRYTNSINSIVTREFPFSPKYTHKLVAKFLVTQDSAPRIHKKICRASRVKTLVRFSWQRHDGQIGLHPITHLITGDFNLGMSPGLSEQRKLSKHFNQNKPEKNFYNYNKILNRHAEINSFKLVHLKKVLSLFKIVFGNFSFI